MASVFALVRRRSASARGGMLLARVKPARVLPLESGPRKRVKRGRVDRGGDSGGGVCARVAGNRAGFCLFDLHALLIRMFLSFQCGPVLGSVWDHALCEFFF